LKNALIYSSSFDGHRQVYVFVIGDVLLKLGFKLFVAGNFSGNFKSTFYLDRLLTNQNISKIDTSVYPDNGGGITNKAFIELQKKYNIELTVFCDADNHIPLFISQILPKNKRFVGKTVGIFLRPFYIYYNLNLINNLRYFKQLKSVWQSDIRFFHEVLNPYCGLVHETLQLDDYFVSKHKKTTWLPDVFQQYADKLITEEYSSQRIWIRKLDDFKNANKGLFFLLYFGTEQPRRGYDQLMKLAVDHNACFIHCGLRNNKYNYEYNVKDLRQVLKDRNHLFETNEYITDPICIEYFFKSVSHLILPYDNFYGSSGVMLQALSYGIPILVPDIGLIGYRVKKYNLGLTYIPNSIDKQFLRFVGISNENYRKSIDEYMQFQNADLLEEVLKNSFTDSK